MKLLTVSPGLRGGVSSVKVVYVISVRHVELLYLVATLFAGVIKLGH
jgi:hypothetical protein